MIMNVYNADQIADTEYPWPKARIKGDRWVLARPCHYRAMHWWERLVTAWRVFTGRYDALHWTGQDDK